MTALRARLRAMPLVVVLSALLMSGCGPAGTPAGSEPTPSASEPAATASSTAAPTPAKPTTKPAPSRPRSSTPTNKPALVLAEGDSGKQVRELQHRLRQLAWYSGSISGKYNTRTVKAVKGFQGKRKLPRTGDVDKRTWASLVRLTRKPTHAERHNELIPGPAILKSGSTGDRVRELQGRLKQIGWFAPLITGSYGSATASAVRGFQAKRSIPLTGAVDQRTWDRLTAMTREPTRNEKHNIVPKPSRSGLDSRCLTGRAMCVSKRTNSLVWVINGKPQLRVDVRFGSAELPTREGAFQVGWKSRHHVSTIYHTSMPYAMFFSGGQAVHYSPDFAARGYNGASHGCVNVRSLSGIRTLFAQVRGGDKVIVYR
jgi:peptidoglycan hydrolase-like protein with peptidoglycan-binding domain